MIAQFSTIMCYITVLFKNVMGLQLRVTLGWVNAQHHNPPIRENHTLLTLLLGNNPGLTHQPLLMVDLLRSRNPKSTLTLYFGESQYRLFFFHLGITSNIIKPKMAHSDFLGLALG